MDGTMLQLVLLAAAVLLYFLVEWRTVLAELRAFSHKLRSQGRKLWSQVAVARSQLVIVAPADSRAVPGCTAMLQAPPLAATITRLRVISAGADYSFPIGWCITEDAGNLIYAALVRGINHVLITGKSDSGKDNLALCILFSVCAQQSPAQVQVCIIDGKGLDFAGWTDRAHTWRLALEPGDIKPALAALTAERERRGRILRAAGVAKWDEYQGGDLPLLVCYISELSLLQDAAGKSELAQWLNSELAAGRAFGMRYIVATQTASNFDTRWRSQVDLFLAGYQPLDSQDEPNTGLTTKKLKEYGGVPPSELPEASDYPGVFTAINGRKVVTIRASYLDAAERRAWLARLPLRAEPVEPVLGVPETPFLPVMGTSTRTSSRGSEPVLADTDAVEPVPTQVAYIRGLAAQGWSRNKIADKLGGNRANALAQIRAALGDVAQSI